MQTVTISDIKSKPTKPRKDGTTGTFTQITTTTGAKASGFDATLANLQKGDIIEWETELKGEFANVSAWKLVTKAADRPSGELAKDAVPPPPDSARPSIEAQTAVNNVVALLVAGAIPLEHPLATLALSWCASRIVATGVKPDDLFKPGKASLPTQQAGQGAKPPASDAPAQKTTIVGKTDYRVDVWPPGMDETKIKDGTDLAIFAGKHGINIDQFRKILGVGKPQDVVQVRQAAHKLFPEGVQEVNK